MKSKKFPLYYLLFALSTVVALVISLFVLKDIPHTGMFSPVIIPFTILFNPAYIAWVLFTIVLYVVSYFVRTDRSIKTLNWVFVALPIIIFASFYTLITF